MRFIRELLSVFPLLFLVAEITASFLFSLVAAFIVLAAICTAAYAVVMLVAYSVTGQLWSV